MVKNTVRAPSVSRTSTQTGSWPHASSLTVLANAAVEDEGVIGLGVEEEKGEAGEVDVFAIA